MTLTSVAKPAGQRWADDRPRNIERLHATVGALGRESGGGTARDGRENEGPLPHLHQAKQQRSCFGRPTLRHIRYITANEVESATDLGQYPIVNPSDGRAENK